MDFSRFFYHFYILLELLWKYHLKKSFTSFSFMKQPVYPLWNNRFLTLGTFVLVWRNDIKIFWNKSEWNSGSFLCIRSSEVQFLVPKGRGWKKSEPFMLSRPLTKLGLCLPPNQTGKRNPVSWLSNQKFSRLINFTQIVPGS